MNDITEKEIQEQGNIEGNICCEKCDYETGWMDMKSAVFKVNMQGGYFMYDGEGGPISQCPACELDKLITRS